MTKINKLAVALSSVCFGSCVIAAEPINLENVVSTTLVQSPQILQQRAQVEAAAGTVQAQTGTFDHKVFSSFSANLSDSPFLRYGAPIPPTDTKDPNFNKNLDQGLNFLQQSNLLRNQSYQNLVQAGLITQFRNGMSANFSVSAARIASMIAYSEIPDRSMFPTNTQSALNFQLNIPLLKGATATSAAAGENAAKLQYQAAQNDLSFLISGMLLDSISAYWDYKVAVETLAIDSASEEKVIAWAQKAEKVYISKDPRRIEEMKAKYKLEIDAVEGYLASKHLTVIRDTQQIAQAKVGLAMAMGTPYAEFNQVNIKLENFPQVSNLKTTKEQLNKDWVEQALAHRNDLKATQLRQDANEVMVKKFTRDLLPQLDVTLNAGYQGIATGSDVGNFIDAMGNRVEGPNLGGQVSFSYPLENNVQEGLLNSQKAAYRNSLIELQQLARKISAQIDIDVSLLKRRMEEQSIATKAVNYYAPTIQNLSELAMKDARLLLALLEYEDRLVGAKTQKLQIEGALAKLIAEIRFQTGTLISMQGDGYTINMKGLQEL